MKKSLLILSIVLAGCMEQKLHIAVQTDCTYKRLQSAFAEENANEFDVSKTYVLYNLDGSKDYEWKERTLVSASPNENLCSEEIITWQGCSESVMRQISSLHNNAKVYCTTDLD